MTPIRIATLTLNPALDIATETDRVVPEHKLRCEAPHYDPGGGGINVARCAVRLGAAALAIYVAGGPNGETIERLLAKDGVAQLAVPLHGRTRESLNVRERSTGAQYRFVLPGPAVPRAAQEACLGAIETLDPPPGFIIVSGSMPAGTMPDLLDRLRDLAQRRQALLLVDTSGAALARVRGAYLLKPSLRELSSLVGRPLKSTAAQHAAARQVIEEGRSETVLLSLGAAGALLVTRDATIRIPAPIVPVCSTVGAGDALLAGVVVALAEGASLAEAARFGVAAGSAALLHPGTGLCTRADVESLLATMPPSMTLDPAGTSVPA